MSHDQSSSRVSLTRATGQGNPFECDPPSRWLATVSQACYHLPSLSLPMDPLVLMRLTGSSRNYVSVRDARYSPFSSSIDVPHLPIQGQKRTPNPTGPGLMATHGNPPQQPCPQWPIHVVLSLSFLSDNPPCARPTISNRLFNLVGLAVRLCSVRLFSSHSLTPPPPFLFSVLPQSLPLSQPDCSIQALPLFPFASPPLFLLTFAAIPVTLSPLLP